MAKKGSLQIVVRKAQPAYDFGIIVQQLESNKSHQPFILVEADWDCKFFRKMLNGNQVNLGKAEEKEKSGYHYVEKIVELVLKKKQHAKVIGIRDRDYTHYERHYQKSQSIFLTDDHSLESMLLHSKNVRDELESRWSGFSAGFIQVLQDARHIAQYYIYSILNDLNVDFNKEKLRLNNFTDSDNGCMKDNWKELLSNKFFAQNACHGKKESDMHRKISITSFSKANDYEICRGHDLLDTSYNTIQHGSLSLDDIMDIMINAYTKSDFALTNLSKELNGWANKMNVELMA